MATFLVICQGIGLAAACGVRPFLPALLAGGLARGALGLDFDRTDYSFLESPIFLLAAAAGLVVVTVIERRRGAPALGPGAMAAAVGGVGIGMGALEFGGSLADVGEPAWPGLVGGLACAALTQAAVRNFFGRVVARLDREARAALVIYLEGLALAFAAVAVVLPPLSLVVVAVALVLLVRGRHRDQRKYAGLRVLR
jgi:hypothetical protein